LDLGFKIAFVASKMQYFCDLFHVMHILLIDNYDSFTYNLVQLLRESGVDHHLDIVPNDCLLNELPQHIDKILISPGPGIPEESGNLMQLIAHFSTQKPMLGICLGHQALALHFGATMHQLPHSFHGADDRLIQTKFAANIFKSIPTEFIAGRYHSWIVRHDSLPETLLPTAFDAAGNLMAFRHKFLPIDALQFHPESYITDFGLRMMTNWLNY